MKPNCAGDHVTGLFASLFFGHEKGAATFVAAPSCIEI